MVRRIPVLFGKNEVGFTICMQVKSRSCSKVLKGGMDTFRLRYVFINEINMFKSGINFIAADTQNNFTMNTNAANNKATNLQGPLQAVGGLLLTGAGLSMANDAGSVRAKGGKWFWYGTLALIVFQAGLCLVAGSVRYTNQK